jgi:putative ABC transport system permease protein
MNPLLHDLQIAARSLLKDRGLTCAAIVVLALGIAANTTVFTIVSAMVFRDLPFDNPDRIVEIGTRTPQRNRAASYLDLLDWRERTRTFDGIAGFNQTSMNVSDDEYAAEQFTGAYISANGFALIGERPVLGRGFSASDEQPGAQPVVVLGHRVWQTRYHGDPAVIGRPIRINGAPAVIVGVMAEGFKFPLIAEVWQPLTQLPSGVLQRRDVRTINAAGRLKAGITLEQARDDLDIVMADLAREYPMTSADVQPRLTKFRFGIGPQWNVIVYALLGAVAFVLLIACANVGNLLLARAADRAREMSVRMAIGASKWQIIRQLLVENVLLAATAGVAGLGLSMAGIRLFRRAVTGTGEPYWMKFNIDLSVFTFFAAICLGAAILFGLAPALHVARTDLGDTLNEAGRRTTGTLRVRRWAGALVVMQLALAPVLLTGAGLMMRALMAAYQADPGISTTGLLRLRLVLTSEAYQTPERRAQFYRQLEARLASLPNLRATLAHGAPMEGATPRQVSFDGRPEVPAGMRPVTSLLTIGVRYFETLGVPVLRGRDFRPNETRTGDVPAIVNARFAARHFGNTDPIGQRVRITTTGTPDPTEPEWVTIVGVAPNVRQRGTEDFDFDPVVYLPYSSNPLSWTSILVRSDSDLALVTSQVREQVRALDPDVPLFDIVTVDDLMSRGLWFQRTFGSVFAIFAVIALITASVGLYAVTARSVAQRTREIGVRMALGADGRQIWWTVTRRVSIQLATGVVLGMTGAIAVARLLRGVLVQISPTDPATLGAVIALLILVGLSASWVPALRAMRLDPVAALRTE